MDFFFSDLNFNSVKTLPWLRGPPACSRFPPATAARYATAVFSAFNDFEYFFDTSQIIRNFA